MMTAGKPIPFSLQLDGSEPRILADLSSMRAPIAASVRTVAAWIQREGTPNGSFVAGGTTYGPGWATIVAASGAADEAGWVNGFIGLHDLDISTSGLLRSSFFGEGARGPVEALHWREISGYALWARSLGIEMRNAPGETEICIFPKHAHLARLVAEAASHLSPRQILNLRYLGGDLAIPNQAVKTDWRFLFAGCPAATYVRGNGVRHADFTKPRKSEPKL
jgi:hypothetical protein